MKRDLVIGGMGGQGIVVGTKLLGAAATKAGLYASHYAAYSGEMRGGWVECTLAVSDEPVRTPPMVGRCQMAVVMHSNTWDRVLNRLRPDGTLILNTSFVTRRDVPAGPRVIEMPATEMGESLGAEMAGCMCVLGAYAAMTGFLDVELIGRLLEEILPPYRHRLLEIDRNALRAGADFANRLPPAMPAAPALSGARS